MSITRDGLRRMVLGVATIGAASGVLLLSDLDSRQSWKQAADGADRVRRIAVVQHASIEALDDGVLGALDALAARGFEEGADLKILRYNAQGDIATSNTIASEVTGANLDMIITVSTLSLQTVANANRFQSSPKHHVFGITSNPFDAGVQVSFDDRLDHPPYMAGLGSLPPVRELFLLLQEIQPQATRVGLVWNPAEANSEAATRLAREVSAELGMTLVEGNAESSTAAGEVALSVMARGVDVLWVSPDITVSTALEVMVDAAQRSGVPVITSLPGSAARGSLLDLGANYYDIGVAQGGLAADILEGRDPATVPVENWMPVQLHVNLTALEGLRVPWVIPDSLLQRASLVVDASGVREQDVPMSSPPTSLVWNREVSAAETFWVDTAQYVESPSAEISQAGVLEGLSDAGMVLEQDVRIRTHSARGDIAKLSSVDALQSRQSDAMLTLSTPALQTALRRVRGTPIVSGVVSNSFIVDAGASDDDHLSSGTGSYLNQPVEEMLDEVGALFPEARKPGTLYTPAKINSKFKKDQLIERAKSRGYEFELVPIALASTRPDVWMQITDNLISSNFPAVMSASDRQRIPVVTFSRTAAEYGPLPVVARDYFDAGLGAGLPAARVLRGESVASIAVQPTTGVQLLLNHDVAQRFGVVLSPELIAVSPQDEH
jgi:ABC-type uncharacterized transport system substrate-binding protein